MYKQHQLSVEFIRENSEDVMEECWSLVPSTRHGHSGWRAARYITSGQRPGEAYEMSWDEYHMFFETLEKAYDAFKRGDLTAGRAAF